MSRLRGLTLIQPWATLMAIGSKTIETRSWGTDYRGDIAIHAGAKIDRSALLENERIVQELVRGDVLDPIDAVDLSDERLTRVPRRILAKIPTKAVLAVVRLIEVERFDECPCGRIVEEGPPCPKHGRHERWFGDFTAGRYGWRTTARATLTRPLPYSGALGLWTFPPEVEQLIAVAARGAPCS